MDPPRPRSSRPSNLLLFVRYGMPALIVVGGIVALAVNPSHTAAEGAGGIVGAGLAVWALNWFFRQGADGDIERGVEEAARDHYAVNGVWPSDEERERFAREGRWREDQPLPPPLTQARRRGSR